MPLVRFLNISEPREQDHKNLPQQPGSPGALSTCAAPGLTAPVRQPPRRQEEGRHRTSRQEKQGTERTPGTSRLPGPGKVRGARPVPGLGHRGGVAGKGSATAEHTGAVSVPGHQPQIHSGNGRSHTSPSAECPFSPPGVALAPSPAPQSLRRGAEIPGSRPHTYPRRRWQRESSRGGYR